MRINEILNVPEQIGLWKLINDTVFTILTQQANSQAVNQQATQGAAKPSPKVGVVKPPIKSPMARPAHALVKPQAFPAKQ